MYCHNEVLSLICKGCINLVCMVGRWYDSYMHGGMITLTIICNPTLYCNYPLWDLVYCYACTLQSFYALRIIVLTPYRVVVYPIHNIPYYQCMTNRNVYVN